MAFTNDLLLKTCQVLKREMRKSGGNLLILGYQTMEVSEDMLDILYENELLPFVEDNKMYQPDILSDCVKFFLAFGFSEVHVMDVSDYENADIIFNLNDDLPQELVEKFDVIFDGGVIEHVFNVGKAFLSICKMTKIGGLIFNLNPVGNYIYNTYFNISPTFFIDFYRANGYKILECTISTYLAEDREKRPWGKRPIVWAPDLRLLSMEHPLRMGEFVRSMYRLSSNPDPETFIVARKTNDRKFILPIPAGYKAKHDESKAKTAAKVD